MPCVWLSTGTEGRVCLRVHVCFGVGHSKCGRCQQLGYRGEEFFVLLL